MYASTHKANQELGWKTLRDLDEMTASAWNWEQRVRGMSDRNRNLK
jgi:UDP-glucose 4-epimerase